MTNLTKRQFEVISFIASFIEEQGYSPCYEEIGEKLGIKSLSTIFAHIGNLEAKGWLTKGYGRSRSLQLTAEADKALKRRKASNPGRHTISVVKRSSDFMAFIDQNKALWGCGKGQSEAVGSVVYSHQKELGIVIAEEDSAAKWIKT